MKKTKTESAGRCPQCESANLDYGISELEADEIGYEVHCADCGYNGWEWYRLVFNGYSEYNQEARGMI